jgi:cysteine desulfurase / selenocysteine lyase
MFADWITFRKQFAVTQRYAYLNNAGVAPLSAAAVHALRDYLDEASEHGALRYRNIVEGLESTRSAFARLVGAAADEIAFVANTSDGLSLVANGIDWKPGDRVLIPEHEFPANVYPWLALERKGVVVERIPFVDGRCPPEEIARRLPGAKLLSVSAVCYANGFRFDLPALGEICQREGVLFCVDGIQALGAVPLDVKQSRIHFLAADGHKWLVGPEGAGCFYVDREAMDQLFPAKVGWRNVKNDLDFANIDFTLKEDAGRFEEGTPNAPGLLALGASCEALLSVDVEHIAHRIKELTDHLVAELKGAGYHVRSPRSGQDWSGIVSFTGDKNDGERLAAAQSEGVFIAYRDGALRASPHAYNNFDDLERLMRVLHAQRPK